MIEFAVGLITTGAIPSYIKPTDLRYEFSNRVQISLQQCQDNQRKVSNENRSQLSIAPRTPLPTKRSRSTDGINTTKSPKRQKMQNALLVEAGSHSCIYNLGAASARILKSLNSHLEKPNSSEHEGIPIIAARIEREICMLKFDAVMLEKERAGVEKEKMEGGVATKVTNGAELGSRLGSIEEIERHIATARAEEYELAQNRGVCEAQYTALVDQVRSFIERPIQHTKNGLLRTRQDAHAVGTAQGDQDRPGISADESRALPTASQLCDTLKKIVTDADRLITQTESLERAKTDGFACWKGVQDRLNSLRARHKKARVAELDKRLERIRTQIDEDQSILKKLDNGRTDQGEDL